MALDEFWRDIRRAGRQTGPSTISGPSGDRQMYLDLWLTPAVVGSFREDDFSFLPAEERAELTAAVTHFRQVAGRVAAGRPATPGEVEQGKAALLGIVRLLDFDRYQDAESFRLGKKVEHRLRDREWPPLLDHLRFESGSDHAGFPALWVWAYLSAAASDSDEQVKRSAGLLRPILREAAREVAPERFPYVSFRSVSDPVVEGASR